MLPNLNNLYYALQARWAPDAFQRWNKDQLLFRNRLEDIAIIWARMRSEFQTLRRRLPVVDSRDFHTHWRLAWKLRVDMESFYVYGDILLDKFVLVARPMFSHGSQGIQFRSFGSFVDSLCGKDTLEEPLRSYQQLLTDRLEWLQIRVCFYRDKFIMHGQSPYQESIHLEPQRGLAVIRRRREDLDARREEESKELQGLLRDIPGLNKATGAHNIAQTIFENLHLVRQQAHKERAKAFVQAVGVDSPPLFRLAQEIVAFLQSSLDFLTGKIPD